MDFSKISINGETRWNVFFFAQIERKHIFAQIQIFKTCQNMKKIRFLALLAALICQFSTIVRANSLELKGDTILVVIGDLRPGDSNGGIVTIHAKSVEIHPNTTIINSELIIIPE